MSAKHTKASALEALHRWVKRTGETPRSNQWSKSSADHPATYHVITLFGTWNRFIKAGGYEVRPPTNNAPASRRRIQGRTTWDKRSITDALIRHFNEKGTWPIAADWDSSHPDPRVRPTAKAVNRHFGKTFAEVVEMAKAEYEKRDQKIVAAKVIPPKTVQPVKSVTTTTNSALEERLDRIEKGQREIMEGLLEVFSRVQTTPARIGRDLKALRESIESLKEVEQTPRKRSALFDLFRDN